MIDILGKILHTLTDSYDKGECDDLSLEQREELLDSLVKFKDALSNKEDASMSKYRAENYVGLGRAQFDNLRREGKLPKGFKEQGGGLRFYKKDLDKFLKERYDKKNR